MGAVNFKKFKSFILDIISFGSSSAIVINISIILLILFFLPSQDLAYLPVRSVYSTIVIPAFFNNTCASEGLFKNCGFYSVGQTRALSSLLHGNVEAALEMNKLVLILFAVMISLFFVNLYKTYKFYKKTGKIFRY